MPIRCLTSSLVCALLLLLAAPARADEPDALPVQDNELVLGTGLGLVVALEPAAVDVEADVYRVGGAVDFIFIGLFNRAWSWLDAEIVLGASGFWLAEPGFIQEVQGAQRARTLLPGASFRGSARARIPYEGIDWLTFGLGLALGVYANPGAGAFTRVDLEASLGFDLWRSRDEHVHLDLNYGYPLFDGLTSEPGVRLDGVMHRVLVRASVGF